MTDALDDELILDRFRQWLQDAHTEGAALDRQSSPGADLPEVGLLQLVEEFTALRHELKLQTRSTRGLQEQSESAVVAIQQAIEQFRAVSAKEGQAAWSAGKALAEALAELDVALERGQLEIDKAVARLVDEPRRSLESALDAVYAQKSRFARWRLAAVFKEVREVVLPQGQPRRELLDALREGYTLIHARLRRALKSEQIEVIPCVGLPVDPERMTVVEVIDDPEHPPGTVVEEIRRGYTWQGRLLRYAEVRAVRKPSA